MDDNSVHLACAYPLLVSILPVNRDPGVILRSETTKNLEILRGVYPEYLEGLRMTSVAFFAEPALNLSKGSE